MPDAADVGALPSTFGQFATTLPANTGFSNSGQVAASSLTATNATNRRCYVPLYIGADTFNRVGVHVSVGGTATWRLGLHASDANGWPVAAPLHDWGTVDVSGSLGRRDITINQAIAAGWYWAVVQVDSYTSNATVDSVISTGAFPPVVPLGFPTGYSANISRSGHCGFWDADGTGGALGNAPASWATTAIATQVPRVVIWKA